MALVEAVQAPQLTASACRRGNHSPVRMRLLASQNYTTKRRSSSKRCDSPHCSMRGSCKQLAYPPSKQATQPQMPGEPA